VAKLTDKEVQRFFDDINKSPGGVKSTEPAFQRYRKQFLRNIDFNDIKKYRPEQLIRGARTSEELFIIGEYLSKEWGSNNWWWQEYHQRRVTLAHLPSLYGSTIDKATGKQRGLWGVPVKPETYIRSSKAGPQKFGVNRRLFSRFANWEQITGQQNLFSLTETPSGPAIRGWKPIKPPVLPSNAPANAIVFDLETTGLLDNENLNVISAGYFDTGKPDKAPIGKYASFDKSLKYDAPIRNKIIPQWEKAVAELKPKLLSEQQLVEDFIKRAESSSKTHALMGYNIKQFDLPVLFSSAKKYGLEGKLEKAVKQSHIVDVAEYAQAFISKQLGGTVVGWEQSELGFKPLGWQLENVAASLGYKNLGGAHEARTDVDMTQFVWRKLKDTKKWDEAAKQFDKDLLLKSIPRAKGYSPVVIKKGMERVNFAAEMLKDESKYLRSFTHHLEELYGKGKPTSTLGKAVKGKGLGLGSIASYSASFVGLNMILPGNFWQNAFTSVTWEAARLGAKKAGVKGWKTWLAAGLGSAVGNAMWMGASALSSDPSDVAVTESGFSGKDDAYNFIQGLGEQGLAPEVRHELTEFGSGWRGSRDLPSSLMGVPIDPQVLAFRRDVIEDKEELAELKQDIKEKQAEAQAKLGDFDPSQLGPISGPVAGLARNKSLKEVNLSDYKLTVEDADTIFLSRKGLAGLFSKDIAVRLSGVDAPEVASHADDPMEDVRIWQEQAGGQWATEQYKKLVEEQDNLRLVIDANNKTYGRRLGVLIGDEGTNLALESVRKGLVAALPFGKSSEDVVSRRAIAQAEEEAKQNEAGIWQFARYKAISEATEEIGQPITFNVLTELTKVARNLNLGTYGSFLESLGEQQRELTYQEAHTARRIGRVLKKTHGKARFSQKFSGKDDNYNTVEGLRHDGGLSEDIRKDLTQFGSGFDIFKPVLQYESISEAKDRFIEDKKKRYAVDKKSRFSGRDDQYNTIEGLLHTGMAKDVRQALTEFGSGWDPVRAMARAIYKNLDEEEALDVFRRSDLFKGAVSKALKTPEKQLGKGVAGSVKGYTAEIKHGIEGVPTQFGFAVKEASRGEAFAEHMAIAKLDEVEQLLLKKRYKNLEDAMIEAEKSALSKQAHDLPSLYGTGKDFGLDEDTIIMEQFKGTPIRNINRELTPGEITDLSQSVQRMHAAGITHGDLHRGNVMLTEEGKIGIIDLGMAERLTDPRMSKHHWQAVMNDPVQKAAQKELGRKVDVEEFSNMLDVANVHAVDLISQGAKKEARPYVQVINQLLSTTEANLIEAKASQVFQMYKQIGKPASIPKRVGSSSKVIPPVQDDYISPTAKTDLNTLPFDKTQPMTSKIDVQDNMLNQNQQGISSSPNLPMGEGTGTGGGRIKKNSESIRRMRAERKKSAYEDRVVNASDVNIPKDSQRSKRMKRFREVSRSAVGIGHRSAHNAGRKHSKFSTVV